MISHPSKPWPMLCITCSVTIALIEGKCRQDARRSDPASFLPLAVAWLECYSHRPNLCTPEADSVCNASSAITHEAVCYRPIYGRVKTEVLLFYARDLILGVSLIASTPQPPHPPPSDLTPTRSHARLETFHTIGNSARSQHTEPRCTYRPISSRKRTRQSFLGHPPNGKCESRERREKHVPRSSEAVLQGVSVKVHSSTDVRGGEAKCSQPPGHLKEPS